MPDGKPVSRRETHDAMTWATNITEKVKRITSLDVSLFTTGPYGAVAWLSGYTDVQALERAQQALNADAEFMEFFDKNVAGVYADDPIASQQTIWRRVVI